MQTPIVLPYYSNLVESLTALVLILRIAFPNFVYVLLFFLLSALVSDLFVFSSDFADVDDITTWGVQLPLPEVVHSFVHSVCFPSLFR